MFECPVCWQRRRKVETLSCSHNICHFCWKKWVAKELEMNGKPWPTCPICRTPQVDPAPERFSALRCVVFVLVLYWLYCLSDSDIDARTPQTV